MTKQGLFGTSATKVAKVFLASLLSVTITLILLVTLALGLILGSQTAREWFVEDIVPEMLSTQGILLSITKFHSPSLDEWSFEAITLANDESELFYAQALYLQLNSQALLHKQLDITKLSADKLSVSLPQSSDTADDKIKDDSNLASTADWLNSLFPINIQKIELLEIKLNSEELEIPSFEVAGSAQLLWQDALLSSKLRVSTKQAISTHAKLDISIDQHLAGTIKASVKEAKGGWLAKLIDLPSDQVVDFDTHIIAQEAQEHIKWEIRSFRTPWFQHAIQATGHGKWEPSIQRFTLENLALSVDQKRQTIQGWWQDTAFEIALDLNLLPLSLANSFQDYIRGGQISGKIHANGDISEPKFDLNIQANTRYNSEEVAIDLSGNGDLQQLAIAGAVIYLGTAHAKASGDIFFNEQRFALDIQSLTGPVRIIETFEVDLPQALNINIKEAQGRVYGSFTSPNYSGEAKVEGQFQDQAFSAQSKFKGDIDKIELSNFLANLANGKLQADGLINWQDELLNLKLDAKKLSIDLLALANIELPETLVADINTKGSLKGTFTLPVFNGTAVAKGQYQGQALSVLINTKSNTQVMKLEKVQASFGEARLAAHGKVNIEQQTLQIDIDEFYSPANLVSLFDVDLPADLDLSLSFKESKVIGPMTDPKYQGLVLASGHYQKQAFNIKSRVKGDLNQIDLQSLVGHFQEGKLDASGLIDWQHERLELQLAANDFPLSLISLISSDIPEDLSALITTKGQLKGSFSAPSFEGLAQAKGHYQKTHFSLHTWASASTTSVMVKDFVTDFSFKNDELRTQSARVLANGHYKFETMALNGNVNISSLPYQVIELAGITLPLDLSGMLDADLQVSGKLPYPVVAGKLSTQGSYKNEPFSVAFDGSQQGQNLVLKNTTLKWRDTYLSAEGLVNSDNLDLHLTLSQLQLEDLNTFGFKLQPGILDINLNLLGSLESPELDGQIELILKDIGQLAEFNTDLHNNTPESSKLEDILINTVISTENERLIASTSVKQGKEAKGQLDIRSTYKPFLTWLLAESDTRNLSELPLDINLNGTIGLAWINDFIDRDIQSITGKLSLDTHIEGPIDKVYLHGSMALQKGSYVNALSQTTINNAEVILALNGQSVKIIKAVASDGHEGSISLAGGIDLSAGKHGLVDFILNLNNASLVRREDIEGEASGSVMLTGDLKTLLMSGNVDVSPFQIMLELIPSDTIPEIKISQRVDSTNETKTQGLLPHVDLDVNVDVDQQAYIRGRGLDAELKGQLKLTGSFDKPNYNGQFKAIRGSYELFSKTFKLEEGDVLFSNDAVSLFVQGRHRNKDMVFIASLSGTLDNLKIGLRTEPPLPEDEALARLLFGRSVRNITPFQAIQLASAIQTLRGEGGGFDPLGTARNLLHVDNITIESQETSEGKGVAVGIGKHLTEGVYVELSRTPEPSQPWKGSVELELTPNINLETTTGGSSGFGGVELQWKKDY